MVSFFSSKLNLFLCKIASNGRWNWRDEAKFLCESVHVKQDVEHILWLPEGTLTVLSKFVDGAFTLSKNRDCIPDGVQGIILKLEGLQWEFRPKKKLKVASSTGCA